MSTERAGDGIGGGLGDGHRQVGDRPRGENSVTGIRPDIGQEADIGDQFGLAIDLGVGDIERSFG